MSALPSEFLPPLGTPPSGQSKIQAIFSLAGNLVLADDSLALSFEQRRAIRHISACRTAESGFNLEVCETCGYQNLHYNSCGDRNCPVCQGVKKEIWVDQRSSEVIDCACYHAVFTCPHELNPLFLANKKLLYSMFHRCVGSTIVELAQDPAYLGAAPGVIQILHTWNQDLISDSRILSVSEDEVLFTARGADGKQSRIISVTPVEFVQRFLLHVLPQGFQKIRYYGYLNNCSKTNNLALIFNLQGFRQYIQKYKYMTKAEIIYQVWGHDAAVCPCCNARTMVPLYRSRARPASSIA